MFVHITGSAPRAAGATAVALAERTAYETARALLRRQIGVVALVGASRNESAASFDAAVVKAAADHLRDARESGVFIRTVRHRTKWMERIDDATRKRLRELDAHIQDQDIPDDEYTGGSIRAEQATLSDGAIVIGGYRGVKETAELHLASCPPKPVEELFVKGLEGGLPEDVRARIQDPSDNQSNADCRTAHDAADCARVACWIADRIARRLCETQNRATAHSPQSGADENSSKSKMRRMASSCYNAAKGPQAAAWAGNLINAIRAAVPFLHGGS